jgi:hypothetical protein
MKDLNKVGQPLFLCSVSLLVLNDWLFKSVFHNELTGKLSDFAGLFAFPFLFSVLFPKKKLFIHIVTVIGFLLWNSPISQGLIDFFNGCRMPINRTIDYTDNIALISVVFSYFALKSSYCFQFHPVMKKVWIVLSCAAFIATSLPPREIREYVVMDKTYQFDISKEYLLNKLNFIQMELIKKNFSNSPDIRFDEEKNIFYLGNKEQLRYLHLRDSLNRLDTLAILIDVDKISNLDTINLKNSFMEIQITGDSYNSEIKLIGLYKAVNRFSDKDFKNKAIKEFEKRVIKKIHY